MKISFKALLVVYVTFLFVAGCEIYREEKVLNDISALGKLQAEFPLINKYILEPKCVSCHSGADVPHGIYLNGYKAIMESNVFPPLIVPGKPEKSSLYTSILDRKMPKYAPGLADIEKKVIYDWILAGAKERPDDPVNEGPGNGFGLSGEPCDVEKIGNEPHFVPCKE